MFAQLTKQYATYPVGREIDSRTRNEKPPPPKPERIEEAGLPGNPIPRPVPPSPKKPPPDTP